MSEEPCPVCGIADSSLSHQHRGAAGTCCGHPEADHRYIEGCEGGAGGDCGCANYNGQSLLDYAEPIDDAD